MVQQNLGENLQNQWNTSSPVFGGKQRSINQIH